MSNTIEARFWSKVERTEGCWNWTAATSHGYGLLWLTNEPATRTIGAHRYAYELLVGPIPHDQVIDHLCRNRACVNPAHMEPVTVKENNLRGVSFSATNAAKTHCKHGHAFDEANTYIKPRGERECRACAQRRTREWRAART